MFSLTAGFSCTSSYKSQDLIRHITILKHNTRVINCVQRGMMRLSHATRYPTQVQLFQELRKRDRAKTFLTFAFLQANICLFCVGISCYCLSLVLFICLALFILSFTIRLFYVYLHVCILSMFADYSTRHEKALALRPA